ncbi:unnamed protein product [Prorocentrum cordatum]|uniref:ABC transmembrane type-1 domain-containing protein n=1 Tax=Prorocentrum cordatum TaxID=2364126 RepID=A0ABN9VDG4_9DINO|nr:unnamed protein product [Polarella glacialis]
MVHPERHPLDSEVLEVTVLDIADFECVTSGEITVPLKELLEFVLQRPFMGYKGGIARLVGKLACLPRGNPTLEAEIAGFNDIDLIYFLRDGEESKKADMKAAVDAGLTIGWIPVEAPDVEYTFDTLATTIATRDLTQNQCIVLSDDKGRVLLVNSKVCREHWISGTNAVVRDPAQSCLDDAGQVISSARTLARALVSQIRGRANQVEMDEATMKYHQSTKLSKTAQFQVFSKMKNNEQYMQAYTQLVQWGFLDRQQYPHVLWGECYAHVNQTLSKHGYRLEPDGELDSRAVEIWKEAKYAEQHARSRVNLFRDFRWHRAVLDTSYTMEYKIQDSDDARSLFLHSIRLGGNTGHTTRDHLRAGVNHDMRAIRVGSDGHIRNREGRRAEVVAGGTYSDTQARDAAGNHRIELGQAVAAESKRRTAEVLSLIRANGSVEFEEEAALDDADEPMLRQSLFGKLTITKTVSHVIRLIRPGWRDFGIALFLSCVAAVLYLLVIKRRLSVYYLLAAAFFSVASCVQFNIAINKSLYHAFRSMFLALINMRLDAFTIRLFPEFWARLTGDSRALAACLKSINDIFIDAFMIVGAALALLWQVPHGCFTPSISDAMLTILACVVLMLATSLVSSLALRVRSRMVRSMVGFTYFQSYSALTRIFEMKAMPEETGAAIAAYSETQAANLVERKNMAVLEEVVSLFLQYVEIACLTVVLPEFLDAKAGGAPGCSGSYSVQAVALSVGLSAVRRLCASFTAAVAGVGSLERFFMLGQTTLMAIASRFDGISTIGDDFMQSVKLQVPAAFTFSVGGSPEFGPFAHVPALESAGLGRLNVMSMPRGSGATSFAKVLLRMHPAPARVILNGQHIEQYEALMLTWVLHIIDHAPFPSNIATNAGQGKTLSDFVQLGLGSLDLGDPLDMCLDKAGIKRKAMNIPFGIESTTWASVMTVPERFQVQLAQALYRISLGAVRVLVAIDPLRGCPPADVDHLRAVWMRALKPLCNSVLVLVIEQSGDAGAWLKT